MGGVDLTGIYRQCSFKLSLSIFLSQKLKEMNEPDSYVRLVVEGGGCSGFQYKFDLGMDSDIGDEDM